MLSLSKFSGTVGIMGDEKVEDSAAALAELGKEIGEKGAKLKVLRKRRSALDEEIQALEIELQPLLAQNAKIVADLVGQPIAVAPAGSPKVAVARAPVPVSPTAPDAAIKKRVVDFLKRADEGISAREVAEALSIDPTIVREAMRTMVRGR